MERLPSNNQALRNKKLLKEAEKQKKASKKGKTFTKEIEGKSDEEMLQIAEQYLISGKDTQDVISAIKKSIEDKPEENGTKYLIVAEALQGQEAVLYFKKGIEVLEKDRQRQEESKDDSTNDIPAKIASALSSIAELYMTPPLCDAPDAEETWETALLKALEQDNSNIDALQGLANLRIMRAKDDEANELLEKVVNIIKQKDELADPEQMPPYDFRLQTSRLLIELLNYKKAIKPLDTLIKEDDTKGEVWYLLAYCHYNLKKLQNASECITNSLECTDVEGDLKDAASELAEKIREELGVAGETSVSEEQTEEKVDLLDDDYETVSEEELSDEEGNNNDEDVEMQ